MVGKFVLFLVIGLAIAFDDCAALYEENGKDWPESYDACEPDVG